MEARVHFTLQGTPVLHADGRMWLAVTCLERSTRPAQRAGLRRTPATELQVWRLTDGRRLRITRPVGAARWTVEAISDSEAA